MGLEFITVYWRDMIKFFRLKSMLFASLIQPVLWLLLFGFAMSESFDKTMAGMPIPDGVASVDYLTFMSAGIIAMTILFTCLYSGIFLQLDKQTGLLKQMLASPMKRSHILLGLTLSGTTKSLLQVIIIIIFGVLVGVKLFDGFSISQVLASVGGIILFVILFSFGLMFLSIMISMKIQSHEGVQAVITMLTLPLFFASNALYPIDNLPFVLKAITQINPMTYFINGVRYFGIGTDFYSFGTTYSYTANDMWISLGFLAVFDIIMFFAALRTFKNARVV